MSIIGVLTLISFAFLSGWRPGAACRKAAREIISVCRTARSLAITTNREHRVEMDAALGRYRIMRGNRPQQSTEWEQIAHDWSMMTDGAGFRTNVKIIQFNTNGTANGGTIRILDGSSKERISVVVNRTGRIRTK